MTDKYINADDVAELLAIYEEHNVKWQEAPENEEESHLLFPDAVVDDFRKLIANAHEQGAHDYDPNIDANAESVRLMGYSLEELHAIIAFAKAKGYKIPAPTEPMEPVISILESHVHCGKGALDDWRMHCDYRAHYAKQGWIDGIETALFLIKDALKMPCKATALLKLTDPPNAPHLTPTEPQVPLAELEQLFEDADSNGSIDCPPAFHGKSCPNHINCAKCWGNYILAPYRDRPAPVTPEPVEGDAAEPVCKTCGDTKKIVRICSDGYVDRPHQFNCPDCTPAKPASPERSRRADEPVTVPTMEERAAWWDATYPDDECEACATKLFHFARTIAGDHDDEVRQWLRRDKGGG